MRSLRYLLILLALFIPLLCLQGCSGEDDNVGGDTEQEAEDESAAASGDDEAAGPGSDDETIVTDGDDEAVGADGDPESSVADGDAETVGADGDPESSVADGDAEAVGADEDREAEPEIEEPEGLPTSLAFSYEREAAGEPLSEQEIEDFTKKLVAFWKKVDFFNWILRVSHGVHETTGKRDYMVWWSGVDAYKEDDTLRFYHHDPDGGGHNIMIPTPRILSSAIGGYFLTGDAKMAKVAEQYCKGITASMLGMVYDENDPISHLMARNIATFNHSYTTDDGRKKEIDYSGWYTSYVHWNTSRFEYPNNPYWESVWVTSTRSKDDVPHIYMAVPHITYAAEYAQDEGLRAACAETLEYLQAFTRDIVDSGYRIRTKDENGVPYMPGYTGDPEADKAAGDLASFVMWEEFIPNAECNAKRASALIGYGEGLENDCGKASSNPYEEVATNTHYYNHAIVRFFHLAHIANALVKRDNDAAETLLEGMAERLEGYLDQPDSDLPRSKSEWNNDLALLALRSAAFGLPLTSREARIIHEKYALAIKEFKNWGYWDLWDISIPEGKQPYRPGHAKTVEEENIHWVRIEDMALLFEYCWSPFKNEAGVKFVDCEIISDPSRWDASYIED